MRVATGKRFTSHDGTEVFYRHWAPETETPAGAIILLHRGHEHSGRVAHIVDELKLPNFAFFAWDARDHGNSTTASPRDSDFSDCVADLQSFVDHITSVYNVAVEDIAIIAQSVGAVIAATWIHDYAPKIRCLALAAPAFHIRLYVPLARPGLGILHRLFGNFRINSYVKPRFLTHDADRIASYQADPLIKRPISVKMLLGVYRAGDRIVEDAAAITTPTVILSSGSDFVVDNNRQRRFFDALGSTAKEFHEFEGFYHDTLGERDRAAALGIVRRFMLEQYDRRQTEPDLTSSHIRGHTRSEADALADPIPSFSVAGLYWKMVRAGLNLASRVSEGIRIGVGTGFDSGSTLDYVYRNQAQGRTTFGRWIDRLYLDSIGWRGIRQRKVNLELMLQDAINRLDKSKCSVRILDIAAGHGRYILDAIAKQSRMPDAVRLYDYSEINVAAGSKLITERGLSAIAHFNLGNAFDTKSLSSPEKRSSLGVVSGLYELYPDNTPVQDSLAGLAQAIEPGGYLIYTCQPWHPQLEFIARALTSHRDGKPWIMRRRTQREMDQLIEQAGFRKVRQLIDPWGIFTVSMAQRVSA